MTRDEVLALCLSLPAAEETYPFGDAVAVIKVCGKMFALVALAAEPGSVNLKYGAATLRSESIHDGAGWTCTCTLPGRCVS